jgi:hypothetical protein
VSVMLTAAVRLLAVTPQPRATATPGLRAGTWIGVGALIGLCGAEEFFWSFLRGAFWEIALTLPNVVEVPAYWAVWMAALLALPLVIVLQPSGSRRLAKLTILVVTSVVFFFTRNFWLCWFLHAAIWLLLAPIIYRESALAAMQPGDQ